MVTAFNTQVKKSLLFLSKNQTITYILALLILVLEYLDKLKHIDNKFCKIENDFNQQESVGFLP